MVDSQPLMPLILLNLSPSLFLTVYFLLTLISVFPGSPVVKTSPSNEGGTGSLSSLLEELRSHVPPGQKKTKQNNNKKPEAIL